jgi:hypothetical protein
VNRRYCQAQQIMLAHGPGKCAALLTSRQLHAQCQQTTSISRPGIRTRDGRSWRISDNHVRQRAEQVEWHSVAFYPRESHDDI